MQKATFATVFLSLLASSQALAVGVSNTLFSISGENNLSTTGVANPFTVGSQSVTLDSVDLFVHSSFFSGGGDVAYTASIHHDNAGSFGAILGTVNTVVDNTLGGFETITLTPVSIITLNANTTYWLLTQIGAGDQSAWTITNSTSETGDPGWSIGNQATIIGVSNTSPTKFAISGTPVVPEPSTYAAIFGLAIGVAVFLRRRA